MLKCKRDDCPENGNKCCFECMSEIGTCPWPCEMYDRYEFGVDCPNCYEDNSDGKDR